MKVAVGQPHFQVRGYRYAGVACGLKQSGRRDVALIVSDVPARLAASFTTNVVKAAPVLVGQERAKRGWAQAILINSGNANAYTGRGGVTTARSLTSSAARLLNIDPELVIPSSTGRIGCALPRAQVRAGVERAVGELSVDGAAHALEGMMTTDAFGKFATRRLQLGGREVEIAGLAKGAGMIAPHMATMLAYVLTDAAIPLAALRRVLKQALPRSFNAIVVDGDMSTNDTVLFLANGVAGNRPPGPGSRDLRRFADAAADLMRELARMIVKDGEGATRVVDVCVRGARSAGDAARVADAIARSPLCKTAFFGGDPYAGRVVCAAGYSGARFDPDRLDVYLDDVAIVRRGSEVVGRNEAAAAAVAARDEFRLTLDLHAGRASAERMTSDLTVDYVRFNSDYRT